ncbi:unnamed protein product [Brassica oleracea var. botrytis]
MCLKLGRDSCVVNLSPNFSLESLRFLESLQMEYCSSCNAR